MQSPNPWSGLLGRSTLTAFPGALVAAGKPHLTSQTTNNSADRQFADRTIVAAQTEREKTMANEMSQDGRSATGTLRWQQDSKPGKSGNPSGRPKKVMCLKDRAARRASRSSLVSVKATPQLEMSKARAIAKSLVNAAVGGNMRALRALLSFCGRISPAPKSDPEGKLAAPEDTEIFADLPIREIRRRTNACHANLDNSPNRF